MGHVGADFGGLDWLMAIRSGLAAVEATPHSGPLSR